jgi:hypothetical protein
MVEQRSTQQGLACPHLAGDGDEALTFFNPMEQVSESFLMGLRGYPEIQDANFRESVETLL